MNIVAALFGLVGAATASPSEAWTQEACHAALAQSFSAYQLRAAPGTSGDYNDDRLPDFAYLLDRKAGGASAAGVCLSSVEVPVVITHLYVADRISTTGKGTRFHDVEKGTEGHYEKDVISVDDGQRNGASYILRGGVFVQIVDRH